MVRTRRIKLVEVLWDDIAGYGPEWKAADEMVDCHHVQCRTAGYLWWRGKKKGLEVIQIVGTLTEDCGVGDVNVIPMGVVREIKTLATVCVRLHGDSAATPKPQAQARRRC